MGKGLSGKLNQQWRGGTTTVMGYIRRMCHDHPRADVNGYVLEHILVAEKAIGRWLPKTAEMHHVNECKHDNRNENLVICEDRAYHQLLHTRLKAYQGTGSVDGLKCCHCKKWGLPNDGDFSIPKRKRSDAFHRSCNSKVSAARRAR